MTEFNPGEGSIDTLPEVNLLGAFLRPLATAPMIFVLVFGTIWALFSGAAALTSMLIFMIPVFFYTLRTHEKMSRIARKAAALLKESANGEVDCGLGTFSEQALFTKDQPAGFAINKAKRTIYLCQDGQVKAYTREQVRDFSCSKFTMVVPEGKQGPAISVRHAAMEAMNNSHQAALINGMRRLKNLLVVNVADFNHPEWVMWVPPGREERYAEMMRQFLDL